MPLARQNRVTASSVELPASSVVRPRWAWPEPERPFLGTWVNDRRWPGPGGHERLLPRRQGRKWSVRTSGSFGEAQTSGLGRQRPLAVGGSSRWHRLVAESLTRPRAPPPPNVKFRGTADIRPRNFPTSGIGARRRSPAESERQQPVSSRPWGSGRSALAECPQGTNSSHRALTCRGLPCIERFVVQEAERGGTCVKSTPGWRWCTR